MDLLDDFTNELEIGVIFACKVKDGYVACLTVAVETTITLLQPRWIPWDVEVKNQPGGLLKVQSFRGNIGGNQDTNRVVGIVEGFNHFSAVKLTCQGPATIEHANTRFVVLREFLLKAAVEVVELGLVLGENDEALIVAPVLRVPPLLLHEQMLPDDLHEALKPRVCLGGFQCSIKPSQPKTIERLIDVTHFDL